jgi:UDP-N-acetylglucosamine--N-acetylmuramyl-(pentapeptide) pyrophosphoryl-undecaprenol N-acetylglucosamine transferase
MSKRVIIAGGGTGGHIFPAVAIGHALQRQQPGTQLLFVGARNKMEMEKVPQEGFEIVGLDIAGFNRGNIFKNLALPFKLLKSYRDARKIIKDFKPDAAVGVGGYASFPILRVAQRMGIPTLVQEQNSFAGKSNQILGKKAKAICVAYANMERFFPKDKLILTGNPVRKSISQMNITRDEGQAWLGGDTYKTTLLIIGGSLGAKTINETIDEQLAAIMDTGLQVVWQTGRQYYEQAQRSAASYNGRVKVYDFIKDMDYAYAAADVVISRAGALAISELCIIAKPVIFVPYPYAAEDHQTSNALALTKKNAALMVSDTQAKSELVKKLKSLLADTTMQGIMIKELQALAIKDADERIANKVLEIIG